MTLNRRDLLMAYRWPAAVVLSCVVVSGVLLRVLSRPIPIRIEGGLQVDRLVLPSSVSIDAAAPLPVTVTGAVPLMNNQPFWIRGPLTVNGAVQAQTRVTAVETPVAVHPVTVKGSVTVDDPVRVDGRVTIDGTVNAKLGRRPPKQP